MTTEAIINLADNYCDHHDGCDLAQPDCSCGMRQAYRAALAPTAAMTRVQKLEEALREVRSHFTVERDDKGRPAAIGYDSKALQKVVRTLDAALEPALVTEDVVTFNIGKKTQDQIFQAAGITDAHVSHLQAIFDQVERVLVEKDASILTVANLAEEVLDRMIRAHDREEAAQRGEPDPWADDFPEEMKAERMAAMRVAVEAAQEDGS